MENLKICSPKEREDLIYAGLKIYTRSCMVIILKQSRWICWLIY